jgi:hypothetical protein
LRRCMGTVAPVYLMPWTRDQGPGRQITSHICIVQGKKETWSQPLQDCP